MFQVIIFLQIPFCSECQYAGNCEIVNMSKNIHQVVICDSFIGYNDKKIILKSDFVKSYHLISVFILSVGSMGTVQQKNKCTILIKASKMNVLFISNFTNH